MATASGDDVRGATRPVFPLLGRIPTRSWLAGIGGACATASIFFGFAAALNSSDAPHAGWDGIGRGLGMIAGIPDDAPNAARVRQIRGDGIGLQVTSTTRETIYGKELSGTIENPTGERVITLGLYSSYSSSERGYVTSPITIDAQIDGDGHAVIEPGAALRYRVWITPRSAHDAVSNPEMLVIARTPAGHATAIFDLRGQGVDGAASPDSAWTMNLV